MLKEMYPLFPITISTIILYGFVYRSANQIKSNKMVLVEKVHVLMDCASVPCLFFTRKPRYRPIGLPTVP